MQADASTAVWSRQAVPSSLCPYPWQEKLLFLGRYFDTLPLGYIASKKVSQWVVSHPLQGVQRHSASACSVAVDWPKTKAANQFRVYLGLEGDTFPFTDSISPSFLSYRLSWLAWQLSGGFQSRFLLGRRNMLHAGFSWGLFRRAKKCFSSIPGNCLAPLYGLQRELRRSLLPLPLGK